MTALGACHRAIHVRRVARTGLVPGAVMTARVPFKEGTGEYKVRPVVVVEVRGAFVLARPCTSADSRTRYADTVEIDDLAVAGLVKATGVRGRIHTIELCDVVEALGFLSDADAERVLGPRADSVGVAA